MTLSRARLAVPALTLAAVLSLAACSSAPGSTGESSPAAKPASTAAATPAEAAPTPTPEAPAPVNLDGEWKQTNSKSTESFQQATITGDTITINWVMPDRTALYWAGTVTPAPTDGSQSFTWDSVNDKAQTDGALLASGDETKTFTYDNGTISYSLTALGETMTVMMERLP